MSRATVCFVIGCFVVLSGPAVDFAAAESAVKVLPKVRNLELLKSRDDKHGTPALDKIEWPATVTKTDGGWYKIGDDGGYSSKPLSGWVRSDDVVKVAELHKHATEKISEAESPDAAATGDKSKDDDKKKKTEKKDDFSRAELYWLRGIYWESQKEHENAIADFEQAISLKLNTLDLRLRLARALTDRAERLGQLDPAAGDAAFADVLGKFACIETEFCDESSSFCPARLYVSWGDAWYKRFKQMNDLSYADNARQSTSQRSVAPRSGSFRQHSWESWSLRFSTSTCPTHRT